MGHIFVQRHFTGAKNAFFGRSAGLRWFIIVIRDFTASLPVLFAGKAFVGFIEELFAVKAAGGISFDGFAAFFLFAVEVEGAVVVSFGRPGSVSAFARRSFTAVGFLIGATGTLRAFAVFPEGAERAFAAGFVLFIAEIAAGAALPGGPAFAVEGPLAEGRLFFAIKA